MTIFLLVAPLVCWLGVLPVAVDPKEDKDGPIEIDYTPLKGPQGDLNYGLRVTLKNSDGKVMNLAYKLDQGSAPEDIAQAFFDGIPKEHGAKLDGNKLIIAALDGKPITKVEIKGERLPPGVKEPNCRRLPKKEADKKEVDKK